MIAHRAGGAIRLAAVGKGSRGHGRLLGVEAPREAPAAVDGRLPPVHIPAAWYVTGPTLPAPPFALSAKVGHELSCVWLAVPLAVAEACSWCAGKYEFKFVVDGSWRVSKFCDVVETAVGGENNVIKVRSTAATGASASVGAPRHHRCADRPYGHPSAGVPLKTAAAILCAARRSSCTVSRDDKDAYLSLARERPLRRKRERERRWAGPCLGRRSALRLRLA